MASDKQCDDGEDFSVTYEQIEADCIRLGVEMTMSREQVDEMNRAQDNYNERRRVEATLNNHIRVAHIPKVTAKVPKPIKDTTPKPKVVKLPKEPKPRYKPPKIYTDEEIKQRRWEKTKARRAQYQAQGLTIRGLPRKEPKPKKSIEEIRAQRLVYAKTYQANNRDKHLAYRRECYYKNKEAS